MSAWAVLGIDPTPDVRAIKRAYGRKLKVTRPEDDAEGFQHLNDAYQAALQMAPYLDGADEQAAPEVLVAQAPMEVPAQFHEPAPVCMPVQAPVHSAAPEDTLEDQEPAWERPVAAFREEAWEHPVPALRVVADERAQRLALEQERRRQREEARAAAEAASAAAFEIASLLWGQFVQKSAVSPKYQLKLIMEGEDMMLLEVREHFELFAIQYCAGAACEDELREAIFAVFGWLEDDAFVRRRLPDATGEAMARLRAGRDYNALLQRASTEPVIAALLADSAGRRFGRTIIGNFTRQMRAQIALIREYHRELLYFKLNPEVVAEWERRVAGRRYFLETALISAGVGVAPFMLASFSDRKMVLGFDSHFLLLFLPLALIAGLAWALVDPLARLRDTPWRDRLLFDLRFRPAVQLGWIPVFALLSALLFIPDPAPAFAWLLGTAMVACTLVACFANSVLFDKAHYIVGAICAVMVGHSMADKGYPGYGYVTCAAGAYCALQLLYRGGADLWNRMPDKAHLLLPLRCVWLAGAIALVAGADVSPLPLQLHAAVVWLWALGGMLLSNPTINPFAAVAGGLVLVFVIMTLRPEMSMLRSSPLSMLISPLFGVAMFMFVNMIRTKKNQHPFS
ncbi:hypothetical protein QPK31_06365 [Massilia sp. YIM B02769]|uniref:hypothetical protein n=1 Tax=unclassified Massilia TaxID=2609279 RepID=UPI0025B702A6|nr:MULTISPECIES: hypothetical protein [unclassified Massilia]MDN4057852.1 hypothetical protein [Massilia sp. YIM B02769]